MKWNQKLRKNVSTIYQIRSNKEVHKRSRNKRNRAQFLLMYRRNNLHRMFECSPNIPSGRAVILSQLSPSRE